MNPIETFGEFSKKLTTTDLALYAGVGIVLWVLFKDQLSPIQKIITDLLNKGRSETSPVLTKPTLPPTSSRVDTVTNSKDVFFDLVVSWKQTRDLAVRSGCVKAIQVADEMFPYLSPVICKGESQDEPTKV
jgi:hypothetical protein